MSVEEAGAWADGTQLTSIEKSDVSSLRRAGCNCSWPYIKRGKGGGLQCRMCGTQAESALEACPVCGEPAPIVTSITTFEIAHQVHLWARSVSDALKADEVSVK